MWPFTKKDLRMPSAEDALPGREHRLFDVSERHLITGNRLEPPFPDGCEKAMFGLGCFWGAERVFWQRDGVLSTAVGYAGGYTPNPTYEEVCTGKTGHNEVVLVVFDPKQVSFAELVKLFFESHDPTQHMRQGNDVGTQYRSGIYVFDQQQCHKAEQIKAAFGKLLKTSGFSGIATEITNAPTFYYAEDYHQQYLAKNPLGYCGLGRTGVSCPVGIAGV